MSALLYIIQSEPLSATIRKNQDIKGIKITGQHGNREIKSKQYVDDTFICLRNLNEIDKCLDLIDSFGKASGSRLNKTKTVGLLMNDVNLVHANTDNQISFTIGPEKVLGITVGRGSDVVWQSLLERVKKKLDGWKKRNLSLVGKVQILKSLGMATILFMSNMKTIKQTHIDKVERIFYDYLWGGKRTKVRREICVLPKELGGIGMVDVKTAVKVQRIKWVIRILQSTNANEDWTVTPLKSLKCLDNRFNVEFFVLRVYNSSKILENVKIPSFYKECIECFQELCRKGKKRTINDIIWCNNELIFNCEPLALSHWAKSGILYR